tara:strand:- start:10240 stop:10644 length:405 start_codon:yes stop_codon:yes gene_type:complete
MGRFQESIEDDNEAVIDMSPLIDCVFILLIFFIVTTVFVEETGVEIDRPEAASSAQLEKNSLLFAITKNGQVVYGGQNVGVAGVQSIVRRELQGGDLMPVIIQADDVSHTGIAVKVIGEAKLGGAEKVSLATRR